MKKRTSFLSLPLVLLTLGACDTGGQEPVVARAADYRFTVSEAVDLMVGQSQLPANPQVVEALANLWIDYTLLAEAAMEDPTLANVDLEPFVRQQLEQELIFTLRDSVIRPDTAVTQAELEEVFRQDAPGVQVRARHVLLGFPDGATAEQRDSVRALAEQIRQRAVAGDDFAELASEYSQDPGSAAQGGDLGFFGRGQMVESFDQAVFALEEGEVSEVVESPFGLHVIKLEERQTPSLEEIGPQFRQQVQQQRFAVAESAYIAGVEERANLEVEEGAVDMVRQISAEPGMQLSGRAGRRALATFEGGELTLAEVRSFLQTRPPQYRQQVQQAPDEAIEEGIIRALAQRELLVVEARGEGLETDPARQDSLLAAAREQFVTVTRELGLAGIEPLEGEDEEQAVQRVVQDMLRSIVQGEREVIPLGPIGYLLRDTYDAEIVEAGIPVVVERVEEARGPATGLPGQAPGQQPGQPQVVPPTQQPPTGGEPVQPPTGGGAGGATGGEDAAGG